MTQLELVDGVARGSAFLEQLTGRPVTIVGNTREAAAVAPADLILVETDAPFLTPVPNRGRQNAPAQVAHTLRAVAELKGLDVAEFCAIVMATGERVLGPWRERAAP